MKNQLFRPFRLSQWFRLAITGLLAGEMGTSGGCNLQFPFNLPSQRGQQFQLPAVGATGLVVALTAGAFLLLAFALALILIYISSRMRFVLFDSVVEGECR